MQFRTVAVLAQQPRGHVGGHMDVADALVQPMVEQAIDQMRQSGDEPQRTGGIQHVLRLDVIAGRHRNAHAACDGRGATAEGEGHVDMHHVDAVESGSEQCIVRLTDRILRESLDFMLWEVEIDDDFSFEAADSQ